MTPPRWDATEALTVLTDMSTWTLPPDRWELVTEILDEFLEACHGQDTEACEAAVADLSPHGPVRVTRIGAAPPTGIPQPVLDRRNVLVHALSGRPAVPPETLSAPAGEAPRGPERPDRREQPHR
ncbi:CATRA system-associated protein [Paractinoplanes brasiliensis]|uniref:CATRA-Associated Small Protein domain-containing protein n=1 Tax=Paractinoplanes brasiliensis TaxID=52695 RepID=A0A4R6JTJ4_9ACTN|nr:hypothetical protein C8E87_1667 [Actinoplanes brasiliensis]